MERCAKALGSPLFPPHVTMCTDPATTKLAAVDSLSDLPLPAVFTALEFGPDYFHGCYLRASDDTALRQLRERCCATLGCASPEPYLPHLSLAYGVLSEDQRAVAAALSPPLPLRVSFDRLELWQCDGPVSSWHKLA
jgi:hypothetical protein